MGKFGKLAAAAILIAGTSMIAGQASAKTAARAPARASSAGPATIAGHPNINGVWQAMSGADFGLEPHSAETSPGPQSERELGAIAAIPASLGVTYSDVLGLPGRPRALGVFFTANYDKFLDARSLTQFGHVTATGGSPSATTTRDYTTFDFTSDELHKQERMGASIRLEYKLADHTTLGISTLLSRYVDDFDRAHPDIVQHVVNVFVKAAQWSSDEANRDALFNEWAQSGVSYASWQAEFAKQSLKSRNSPLVDPFIVARYQAVADDALKLKLIRQPVSVDGWFETRYLDNALRAQGLEHYWTRYDAQGKPLG